MMSAILQIHSTQCTVHISCIHTYHVYLAIFHLCEKKWNMPLKYFYIKMSVYFQYIHLDIYLGDMKSNICGVKSWLIYKSD
jgi:hypothetical protein